MLWWTAVPAAPTPLLPQPLMQQRLEGEFILTNTAFRPMSDAAYPIAATLAERSARMCGHDLPINVDAPIGARIDLYVQATAGADASYRIEVGPTGVQLSAASPAGLHQAANTFLQMLCAAEQGRIPAQRVIDAPRFAWRGALLDSARHMQSVDFIKRFLDAMAWHRLNVLHWHLTDDQGWRLEIKQYPRLTDVGAYRVPAGAAGQDAEGQPTRYGGFYTQDEAREIVAYAAARGITVVPEIDVPAHASAIVAAYPEFGAIPEAVKAVPADWGIYQNLLSLDAHTQTFVENVLREVMAIFPSPYLHVGGDELDPSQWQQSEAGQALIAELGRSDRETLQAWYSERLARFVAGQGRRLVGWDEMLSEQLDRGAVIMSWRGIDGGLKAVEQGHDTVLSPWPDLYLDNSQSDAGDEPPGRVRQVTLESIYRFNPMPKAIAADKRQHVLGIQANLWSEHIRTEARMAHMAFPRLAALAEVAWSEPAQHDWSSFLQRLPPSFRAYRQLQLPAADSAFAPRLQVESDAGFKVINQAGFGKLRAHPEREPTASDPVINTLSPNDGPRYVRAFLGSEPMSAARRLDPGARAWQRGSHELKRCGDAISIHLEDDAPASGPRARFTVDIQDPCWIWPSAPLPDAASVQVRVGQVPFNFQIGAAKDQIQFVKPRGELPELVLYRGSCQGPELLRLPLTDAVTQPGVTTLPALPLPPLNAVEDVCFRFAQHRLEPVWVIDHVAWSQR